ncbi:MAG: hypothetical protein R3362_05170, partial [Rhodothermales bacterium]|nr:hypothetical protein [Rhodothermales bacterium]
RGGFDLAGQVEQLRFGARVLLDGRESDDRQPLHRFLAFGEYAFAPWAGLRLHAGDTYPALPNQLVSGLRVRGVGVGLRVGFFNFDVVTGQTRRGVGGTLIDVGEQPLIEIPATSAESAQAAAPFDTELVGQDGGVFRFQRFRRGTYSRSYASIRPSFGQRERFQFGLTYLHVVDDADSVERAFRPQENLVLGSDLFLGFDRRRVQLELEGAVSLTNLDTEGGAFDDADYDTLVEAGDIDEGDVDALRDVCDFAEPFFTCNENVFPLNPFGDGLPGVMGEGTLSVLYGQNVFRAYGYRRGTAFRTFANPFLQNDLQGVRLSDRARFLDGALLTDVTFEYREDNVSNTQDFTTQFNEFSASVSYFPRQDYPSVTVGLGTFGRSSDRTVLRDGREIDALDDSALRLYLTSTYRFMALGPEHFALFSISTLNRDDATEFDLDASNTYAQLALTTRFLTLPLKTRLTLSTSANEAGTFETNYTGFGGGLSYGFLNEALEVHADVTQYVGDLERTILRLSGDYDLPAGHTVAARFAYYVNDAFDDSTVASIVYRYRL